MLAASLGLGAAGIAVADVVKGTTDKIIEAGPISAATGGYPTWYRDSGFTEGERYHDSVDLEPCLGDKDPMCLPAPAPDPSKPMRVDNGNWPTEFFYYNNSAAGLVSNGANPVLFESALEGAWAAEVVNEGDQIVFGRIRIRVENLQPGSEYTVVHPQGEDRFTAEAGRRSINYTQDISATPGNFNSAFKSRVGPFLRWAPNADDPTDRPPAGYIGDPATDHKVVGSPHGTNYVMITGPQVGAPTGNPAANPNLNPCPAALWNGPVEDCIYTDLFNLMGKESRTGGVDTNRATYSRTDTGTTTFDVFARSKGSQAMIVRDGEGTGDTRFATTPLVGRQGKYFGHVGVSAGALPKTVTVVNTSDTPDSTQDVPLKDLVTVPSAVYDTAAKTLEVTAQSSDKLQENGAPVAKLTLPEFGNAPLDANGVVTVPNVPVAPATVKVASTQGDVGVGSVVATGPASPALSAMASGPATAEQGSKVTLSGLNSLGQIDTFAWTAPDGVTLTGADTAMPSFIVPRLAAGADPNLTFTLKVTGTAGSETATVTVKVLPIADPKAAITPIGTVELGTPVTLDGSNSTGAATYLWEYLPGPDGPATIDLGPVDGPTLKFTMPTDVPLGANGQPLPLNFRLTVKNIDGAESSADIALNGASTDQLTTTKVRFIEDKARWTVEGTARLLGGNEVTVHAGPDLTGKVIGTTPVINTGPQATLGTFILDLPGSGVTLRDALCNRVGKTYCVSLESTRGASLVEVVVENQARLTPPAQLPAAPAPVGDPTAGAGVTVQGLATTGAVPVVGALRFAIARVTAPAVVTAGAVATTGIPVAFTAPAGATLARLRVLTAAGTPLLSTFQKVKGGTQVRTKIRSAKLRGKLRAGRRYVIEVRAGKSKARLGKATRKTIRIR